MKIHNPLKQFGRRKLLIISIVIVLVIAGVGAGVLLLRKSDSDKGNTPNTSTNDGKGSEGQEKGAAETSLAPVDSYVGACRIFSKELAIKYAGDNGKFTESFADPNLKGADSTCKYETDQTVATVQIKGFMDEAGAKAASSVPASKGIAAQKGRYVTVTSVVESGKINEEKAKALSGAVMEKMQ